MADNKINVDNQSEAPKPAEKVQAKPATPAVFPGKNASAPQAKQGQIRGPNMPHPHPALGHSETSGQAASHQAKIAAQHTMTVHDLSKDPAQVYAYLLECSCGYQARSHSKEQAEMDKTTHLAHKSYRASVR